MGARPLRLGLDLLIGMGVESRQGDGGMSSPALFNLNITDVGAP